MRVKILSKVNKFWTPREKNLILIKMMIFVNKQNEVHFVKSIIVI